MLIGMILAQFHESLILHIYASLQIRSKLSKEVTFQTSNFATPFHFHLWEAARRFIGWVTRKRLSRLQMSPMDSSLKDSDAMEIFRRHGQFSCWLTSGPIPFDV